MESFEVLKTLGRGNYGQALLVKDKRLPEPGPGDDPEANLLVVKRVPLADMPEAEQRAAMREVALLKALEHPCIVRYLDSFIQDGSLHICMEYCSAGDLGSAIRRARKSGLFFDEGQVLDWFAQVTLAVAYAHKRSVFHRDLKPQNIFLTRTNRVRLGDWGIARVLEVSVANQPCKSDGDRSRRKFDFLNAPAMKLCFFCSIRLMPRLPWWGRPTSSARRLLLEPRTTTRATCGLWAASSSSCAP